MLSVFVIMICIIHNIGDNAVLIANIIICTSINIHVYMSISISTIGMFGTKKMIMMKKKKMTIVNCVVLLLVFLLVLTIVLIYVKTP